MFPHAIYFDTCAIRKGGEFLNVDTMPRVIAQANDYGIKLHVVQVTVDELLEDRRTKLTSWRNDVIERSRLIYNSTSKHVVTQENVPAESDLLQAMEKSFLRRLIANGINTVPNKSADLHSLIERAVKKTPPFQEGDRGFRDAVIIDSVVAHATHTYQGGWNLVVSDDKRFRDGIRFQADKGAAISATTLDEVLSTLEQCAGELIAEITKKESEIITRLLEQNFDMISSDVSQREISSSTMQSACPELKDTKIECVLGLQITGIKWAQPQEHFYDVKSVGERVIILFGVGVDFDLRVSKSDSFLWMCGPNIPLNEEGLGPLGPPTYPARTESEVTVSQTILIHATTRIADMNELDDLHILSGPELLQLWGIAG